LPLLLLACLLGLGFLVFVVVTGDGRVSPVDGTETPGDGGGISGAGGGVVALTG
jgi:hypothetical protein